MTMGSGGMMAMGSGGMMAMGSGGMMMGSGGMTMDAGPKDTGGGTMDAGMDTGGGGMLTFAKDIQPVLVQNCAPCHTANGDGGMSVMAMLSAANSVLGNVSAAHTNCAMVDASKKRIVPGMPMKSYLYLKVTMTTAALGANCGNAMPNMRASISAANKTLIQNWIMQGAM
jgi:hypothetical protein